MASEIAEKILGDGKAPEVSVEAISPLSEISPAPISTSPNRYKLIETSTEHIPRPARPKLERRTTLETQYIQMLLSQDEISAVDNVLAHVFTWILLAGFLVFPATFTTLSDKLKKSSELVSILAGFKNGPFLYTAGALCGVGVLGMLWLWYLHRRNYIWLINRIFAPGFANALAGVVSTIVNIYSAENGDFSVTAEGTVIVTGALSVLTFLALLAYQMWALARVKKRHRAELGEATKESDHNFALENGGKILGKVNQLGLFS